MEPVSLFFFVFAALAIAFSLLVVVNRNPVSSAFSLVVVFFNFAAIYAILGAHLLAAMQILVYAGAIMVLFIFVIMLLNADSPSFDSDRIKPFFKFTTGLIMLGFLALFFYAFGKTGDGFPLSGPFTQEAIENSGGNTRVLSEVLFSEYLLPFELTSILLLAAVVGAVAIAKRKKSLRLKGERV